MVFLILDFEIRIKKQQGRVPKFTHMINNFFAAPSAHSPLASVVMMEMNRDSVRAFFEELEYWILIVSNIIFYTASISPDDKGLGICPCEIKCLIVLRLQLSGNRLDSLHCQLFR